MGETYARRLGAADILQAASGRDRSRTAGQPADEGSAVFCGNCGAANVDSATYCAACGQPVSGAVLAPASPVTPPARVAGFPTWAAFLVAGLLVAGIGAGAFFYMDWTAKRAAEQTAAATAEAFAQGQAAAKAQTEAQAKADAEAAAAEASAAAAASSNTGTGSQSGTGSSTTFDPATATRVPGGQAPKEYVRAYYQAILDKQWQKAFDMQPYASKVGGTVAAFQKTQEEMYGMTAFSIFSDATSATSATVVVRQNLGANGIWNVTWGFVYDGTGTWLVKTRVVALGEPVK